MSIASLNIVLPALAILRLGDRGADVRELQQRLNVADDGEFGLATEEAVRRFQWRRGLEVDGIAGNQTLRALGLSHLIRSDDDERLLPPDGSTEAPYVVLVPGDTATLAAVELDYPEAYIETSRLGSFVRVGSFSSRSRAEAVVRDLRRRDLRDARVEYRPDRLNRRLP